MYTAVDYIGVLMVALMTLGPLAMAPAYPAPEDVRAASSDSAAG